MSGAVKVLDWLNGAIRSVTSDPAQALTNHLGAPLFATREFGFDIMTLQVRPAGAASSSNPATGEMIDSYPYLDTAQTQELLARSYAAFEQWRVVAVSSRCGVLAKMSRLLREDSDTLARTITTEMGKTLTQAKAEVLKTADALDWYAINGSSMLQEQSTAIGENATVRYLPLGPILSVQPWNYPVWQPIRAAAAVLLGGNSYILKPAPNVVGCALRLGRLWVEAGLPADAFSVFNAEPDQVSVAIADDRVAAVTVTGSVGAGSAIAAQAGKAIKKSVLELGGSDAFIVLGDADIDAAAEAAVISRFQNNGQVCIAAKRIIVDARIKDGFVDRFISKVAQLRVGDPRLDETDVGPLARQDIRSELEDQVRRATHQGARVLVGGRSIVGPGFYFEPTVLDDVQPGMATFDEEVFGPVASIVTATSTDEAIALANTSPFGLSASIWTQDTAAAEELSARLEVGGVFINKMAVSDPRIPIGGVRKSGFGRELSHFGIHEFMNVQSVWVESGTRTA